MCFPFVKVAIAKTINDRPYNIHGSIDDKMKVRAK